MHRLPPILHILEPQSHHYKMSFGRPPTYSTFSVTPPDRGSFPLDHDGKCKVLAHKEVEEASDKRVSLNIF